MDKQYSLERIFLIWYIQRKRRKHLMDVNINTILNALAEPNRLQIIELLREGPLTVGEIAKRVGLLQPQTSKHLRVLSNVGLVEVQAFANRRIYQLHQKPFRELDDWLGSFQNVWKGRFDRLEDYLREVQGTEESVQKDL